MDDSDPAEDAGVGAFAERIFTDVLGAMETLAIYTGDRLGLYRMLGAGPATSGELAERAGIHPRYAREWCEQQAVAGILSQDDDGRFALPAAHATVLVDGDALAYTAPLARLAVAAATRMPELLASYRLGTGIPWGEFGADARDAQGDINRPWFLHELGAALATVDDVHGALARRGARIADIGCGHGWSSVALARAYPAAEVVGIDVDAPSLDAARAHGRGIANLSFVESTGAALTAQGRFDVAFVFEALHDMPHPVDVLTGIRTALHDDGQVIVMDEAVASDFAPGGDEIERIMYAYSLFLCLPDSMSTAGSVATGTVMRPAVLEGYAAAAGFGRVDVLPIEGFAAFRFYRLRV